VKTHLFFYRVPEDSPAFLLEKEKYDLEVNFKSAQTFVKDALSTK